jgi:sigma-B regulation protein RsbU (phosphoserine phosphatase)
VLSALRRELHEWSQARSVAIHTAQSPSEGLAILEEIGAQTAVVVSDLRMPEMLGSDFLLKVGAGWPDIVTILLSGFSEPSELVKAVRAGIHSYILKPWDQDYLISELDKAMEYYRMRDENRQNARRLEEELRWAGEMQRSFLKANAPRRQGLEIKVSYRPLPNLHCGGDYYDVIYVGADRYLLLIGDVEGHGVRGAFVTGILKAVIYSEYVKDRVDKDLSPAAFLAWLNDRMLQGPGGSANLLITFFAGMLDLRSRRFTYSNAGQNRPFLVRGGKAIELHLTGPAFGMSGGIAYREEGLDLLDGDLLFLYTDGLSEVGAARDGASLLDVAGILERVPYSADFHRAALAAAIAESNSRDFTDDLTMITAKIGA